MPICRSLISCLPVAQIDCFPLLGLIHILLECAFKCPACKVSNPLQTDLFRSSRSFCPIPIPPPSLMFIHLHAYQLNSLSNLASDPSSLKLLTHQAFVYCAWHRLLATGTHNQMWSFGALPHSPQWPYSTCLKCVKRLHMAKDQKVVIIAWNPSDWF